MAVKQPITLTRCFPAPGKPMQRSCWWMADEGLDFVFTYTDNVTPSSSAGKLIQNIPTAASTSALPSPTR